MRTRPRTNASAYRDQTVARKCPNLKRAYEGLAGSLSNSCQGGTGLGVGRGGTGLVTGRTLERIPTPIPIMDAPLIWDTLGSDLTEFSNCLPFPNFLNFHQLLRLLFQTKRLCVFPGSLTRTRNPIHFPHVYSHTWMTNLHLLAPYSLNHTGEPAHT